MRDIANRFPENPLLSPKDLLASNSQFQVICLLNPGVFIYENKIWLIVRVAENISQKEGSIFFPVVDESGEIEILEILLDDPPSYC
jgi:predicted GH43/DUF377 family glycosyl hydrolase